MITNRLHVYLAKAAANWQRKEIGGRTMQPIEKSLWTIFAVIGFATIAGLVVLFAYFAFDALRDVVRQWRQKRKYKHRFDKPPTAKCYCKDCVYHGTKYKDGNNACRLSGVNRYTADDGFCYMAEPRKRELDND